MNLREVSQCPFSSIMSLNRFFIVKGLVGTFQKEEALTAGAFFGQYETLRRFVDNSCVDPLL